MKKYEGFYGKQEFYKKDEAYFESFSYFPKMIDIESHREALQKLKSIDFLEVLYQHKREWFNKLLIVLDCCTNQKEKVKSHCTGYR